ncbi:hypothetical protein R1flu_022910 [Riccia fluitans]|uniref:MI domain-containing protein n=1 Tax=Riccia fluitans TaxID=41844 RepID=A0ABD1XUL2_9MARC
MDPGREYSSGSALVSRRLKKYEKRENDDHDRGCGVDSTRGAAVAGGDLWPFQGATGDKRSSRGRDDTGGQEEDRNLLKAKRGKVALNVEKNNLLHRARANESSRIGAGDRQELARDMEKKFSRGVKESRFAIDVRGAGNTDDIKNVAPSVNSKHRLHTMSHEVSVSVRGQRKELESPRRGSGLRNDPKSGRENFKNKGKEMVQGARSEQGRWFKRPREFPPNGRSIHMAKKRRNESLEVKARINDETERVKKPVRGIHPLPFASERSGGVYIPLFKLALAQMPRGVEDKSSNQYQRLTWEVLKKSINGLLNKANVSNLKNILPAVFSINLIRGRGLFARSCIKSQMTSPTLTHVFAALVAGINMKLPELGELILKRVILEFRRAYKGNEKPVLLAAAKFIAHLVNQQVAHATLALELLRFLLKYPTDYTVEVAVGFLKECGAILHNLSSQGLDAIFERFRGILLEVEISRRVQFMVEVLFTIRKAHFQGYATVLPELELVEQEDRITHHQISLEDDLDDESYLDDFKPDPNFLESEREYEAIRKDILGDISDDHEDGTEHGSEVEDEEEKEHEVNKKREQTEQIQDETGMNLFILRVKIYIAIMSTVDFEEAGRKLYRIRPEPGQEMEFCIILLECCIQACTYRRYYGLLGQRLCMISHVYQDKFDQCFFKQYCILDRLETRKLRNIAKFFAHLLGTDALPWQTLAYIRLTEADTTSSSRIFIKMLFQELSEHLGLLKLNQRLSDPMMQESLDGIFPKDNPKNTRFAINFFTSIGLGGLTYSPRDYLTNTHRMLQLPGIPSESK